MVEHINRSAGCVFGIVFADPAVELNAIVRYHYYCLVWLMPIVLSSLIIFEWFR